jgi:hypothetical protein
LMPWARAAETDFNGRWDLEVHAKPSDIHFAAKAWWLGVTGAGTPEMKIQLVGSPDGSLDDITESKIQDGVLHFAWVSKKGDERLEYVVKDVNGVLDGTMKAPDGTVTTFTGHKTAEINEHDDGSWVKGKPIQLFNGKDLTGWTGVSTDKASGWSVVNGILQVSGQAEPRNEDLRTVEKFWNFELHVEYNLCEKCNSGIALRGRYEVQIAADAGAPPGMHGTGAVYTRVLPEVNAAKPVGEWQTYDIRLVGREVTATLNGQKLYDKAVIEGLTGLASDPYEGKPGPIEFQGGELRSGRGPIQFRNIVLTPLTQHKGKSASGE